MAALAVVLLVIVLGAVALSSVTRPASSTTPQALASPSLAAAVASSTSPDSTPFTSASAPAASTPPPSASAPDVTASPHTGGQPGLPDPSLTPGALNPAVTPANLRKTICAKGWTATIRPPSSYTTALKRRQIAEYGYTDTVLAHYEEDHLVSLELGGDPRDPANLWPEPYTATLPDGTSVGARVKDQVENRLNDLVCSGDMPLATAQHLIATDWIEAWRTYVAP